MESQWTDKSAIMRDLSFAQGRWVPGGIDTAVASGKPPTHKFTEETEEEYFKRWTTDGDFNACPDLSLISKMIEMVHDEVPDSQDTQSGPIEIKKLNPVAKVFVPKFKKAELKVKETRKNVDANVVNPITVDVDKKKKPLRKRNVAIASILANSATIASQPPLDIKGPIKLVKPADFIKTVKKTDKDEAICKVNSWLQSQDMSSMFKKKTDSVKSPLLSDVSCQSAKSPPNLGQQYIPSSWAGEYYRKCMDRTHIRDMVQESVWARAEQIMKGIDLRKAEEQRKQEEEDAALAAALAAAAPSPPPGEPLPAGRDNSPAEDSQGIASILLPEHRHQLTGDCIVCEVLSKPPADKETLETGEAVAVQPEEVGDDKKDDEGDEDDGLDWPGFVEALTVAEAAEHSLPLDDSGSTEVLDMSSDS